MNLDQSKITFLESQFWILTIGAAFQHTGIYKKELENNYAASKQKIIFRQQLQTEVIALAKKYQQETISEVQHIENIESITKIESNLLALDHLPFGIAQKIVNLYLKYLWCAGLIQEPPHCPIDRVIQQHFKLPIVNWTAIEFTKEKYKSIIKVLQAKNISTSLAQFELIEYQKANFKEAQEFN